MSESTSQLDGSSGSVPSSLVGRLKCLQVSESTSQLDGSSGSVHSSLVG